MCGVPTAVNIELYWKYIGWVYRRGNPYHFKNNPDAQQRDMGWYHPNANFGLSTLPSPHDIQYLVGFAIPKLQKDGFVIHIDCYENKGFYVMITDIDDIVFSEMKGDCLEIVLFHAIYEVVERKMR